MIEELIGNRFSQQPFTMPDPDPPPEEPEPEPDPEDPDQ